MGTKANIVTIGSVRHFRRTVSCQVYPTIKIRSETYRLPICCFELSNQFETTWILGKETFPHQNSLVFFGTYTSSIWCFQENNVISKFLLFLTFDSRSNRYLSGSRKEIFPHRKKVRKRSISTSLQAKQNLPKRKRLVPLGLFWTLSYLSSPFVSHFWFNFRNCLDLFCPEKGMFPYRGKVRIDFSIS